MTTREPSRALSLAVRAFPRRWRIEHGEEFLATAVELRAAGLTPWGLRTVLDTVIAGFGVRLRTRPPLRHWLAYRFANRPVPSAWYGWMRDDLSSSWAGVRFLLLVEAPLLLLFVLQWSMGRSGSMPLVSIGASALLVLLAARYKTRQIRRRFYEKVGWAADGSVPPPPGPGDRIGR